jgi:hypothetical protein
MRTIETTVYKYDELPTDAAKERAREWWLRDGLNYDWYDSVYEDAKAIGAILGFTIDRISFSGFYSQGDGASFVGSYYYAPGWRKRLKAYAPLDEDVRTIGETLQAIQKRNRYGLRATIGAMGQYSHEGTMKATVEDADGREVPGDDDAAILECARDFARWIYKQLEAEHEYLTGEESVSETLRANEYEFTADGRPT